MGTTYSPETLSTLAIELDNAAFQRGVKLDVSVRLPGAVYDGAVIAANDTHFAEIWPVEDWLAVRVYKNDNSDDAIAHSRVAHVGVAIEMLIQAEAE